MDSSNSGIRLERIILGAKNQHWKSRDKRKLIYTLIRVRERTLECLENSGIPRENWYAA
jgi:hypothetical protein